MDKPTGVNTNLGWSESTGFKCQVARSFVNPEISMSCWTRVWGWRPSHYKDVVADAPFTLCNIQYKIYRLDCCILIKANNFCNFIIILAILLDITFVCRPLNMLKWCVTGSGNQSKLGWLGLLNQIGRPIQNLIMKSGLFKRQFRLW